MSVTLHTTLGDIKLELFCEKCPKTCENFLALCASDYYKDNVFTRNIKDFMVQTGDPTNTGKGGESIWGTPFEDELHPDLKHDQRGSLSMANNGPNKNKSQFFITYKEHPHLDLKYTTFGKLMPSSVQLSNNVSEMLPFMQTRLLRDSRMEKKNTFLCPSSLLSNISSPSSHSLLSFSTSSQHSSSLPQETDQAAHIRQMQEYFNQYIEEYEEVEDVPEEHVDTPTSRPIPDSKMIECLSDAITILEQERAQDIVVLNLSDVPGSPCSTMVICSPYNVRHAKSLAEQLRRCSKSTVGFASVSRRQTDNSGGWFCVDFNRIQIHVMDKTTRSRYDLETLWCLDSGKEEIEEDEMLPPPRL